MTIDKAGCNNLDILYSKVNLNNLEFKKLFSTNFELCLKGGMQSGGRLDEYDNDNLLVSVGDFGFVKLKMDNEIEKEEAVQRLNDFVRKYRDVKGTSEFKKNISKAVKELKKKKVKEDRVEKSLGKALKEINELES